MENDVSLKKDSDHVNESIFTPLLYGLPVLIAVILPLIIWKLKLSFVSRTYDASVPWMSDSEPFELFGLFIASLFAGFIWLELKKKQKKTLANTAPLVLFFLVFLNLLFNIVENSNVVGSDYRCYESAAQAIADATNPYNGKPPCYLYPPLLAQILAFLYQVAAQSKLAPSGSEKEVWEIVFYLYQCSQIFQIVLAYFLCHKFILKIGVKILPASLFVSAIFLFNSPLLRTLKFSQINFWILNSFLLAILLLRRYPFFSGFAVALGGHLKLYSLALLIPWGVTKKWKAFFSASVCFIAIAIIQTGFGQDWTLWQQFGTYFGNVEKPTNYRNNGVYGIVYNIFKIPKSLSGLSFSLVPVIVAILSLGIIIWFAVRFIQREKIYANITQDANTENKVIWDEIFRCYGHSVDTIAFSLLISPSVWEHHYVIGIPLALWAIATRGSDKPWLVSFAIFLIFGLPTFDFFPLSYHNIVGLIILVYLTSPKYIQSYFINTSKILRINNL